MSQNQEGQGAVICLVCAWRQDCVKKFSFTGGHCQEFTKDITVKEPNPEARNNGKNSQ
jgi:hypothetical protein